MKQVLIQRKLARMQLFIILPSIILVIFIGSFIYFHNLNQELNDSITNRLKITSDIVDEVYSTTAKFLEKPYSNTELNEILNVESENYTEIQKIKDFDYVPKILYKDFIYYNPYITSIIIVPTNREEFYLKYYNYQNVLNYKTDFKLIKENDWYKNAVKSDNYIISNAYLDPLFVSNNPIISFMQRIKDPSNNKLLGVIKINISVTKLEEIFNPIIENTNDELIVLDKSGSVIYSSDSKIKLLSKDSYDFSSIKFNKVSYENKYKNEMTFHYYSNRSSMVQSLFFPISLIILFSLFIISILIYLVNKSSDSFSRPILKLKKAMKVAETGDFSIRSEAFDGEMNELSNAFNSLMNKMDTLINDIQIAEFDKSNLRYEIALSKVNPHFLYNTLNAIKWKAEMMGVSNIADTLDSLVAFLKATIKDTNIIITLAQELELLEHYMQIIRLRYEDDIEVNYDIDEECLSCNVAKLCIQPIIENCYIHAFQLKKTQKEISITIYHDTQYLYIIIKDNGDGMLSEDIEKYLDHNNSRNSNNIGVDNVNQRIKRLFGEEFGVKIESDIAIYTSVIITIPFKKEN